MRSLRHSVQNHEMPQFSQSAFEAREFALSVMQTEATQFGASGIVEVEDHVLGDHATEFQATAPAIRRLARERASGNQTPSPPPPWNWWPSMEWPWAGSAETAHGRWI